MMPATTPRASTSAQAVPRSLHPALCRTVHRADESYSRPVLGLVRLQILSGTSRPSIRSSRLDAHASTIRRMVVPAFLLPSLQLPAGAGKPLRVTPKRGLSALQVKAFIGIYWFCSAYGSRLSDRRSRPLRAVETGRAHEAAHRRCAPWWTRGESNPRPTHFSVELQRPPIVVPTLGPTRSLQLRATLHGPRLIHAEWHGRRDSSQGSMRATNAASANSR